MSKQRLTITSLSFAAAVCLLAGFVWGGPTSEDCERMARAADPSCASCALLCSYIDSLAEARIDVAAIDNGIIVHASADAPAAALGLQRYAFARQSLFEGSAGLEQLEELCAHCEVRVERVIAAQRTLANSTHGVFTLLTSDQPKIVEELHHLAAEVVLGGDVRGL